MVEQSVPADSVSALRESALAAVGVRGIFTNLIDGKSVGARNTLDVLDPATGELLAKVPDIERDGMDAAFAAARRAFSSGSKLTWEARRSILEKAFENVKTHREELVTLLMAEGGRPRSLALWEVAAVLDDFAPGVLAQSLPDVETTQPGVGRVRRHYAPLGVVAAISPWNLPLLLSYDKVVPALIAGNTVVLKPSFYTPLTVLRVAELVRDILPAGILNVMTGGDNVGPWMTSHPEADKISFTGSTQTGRRVFESASQTLKHLTLELGGNDAGIVLPDVDVDAAIAPIFWGMFLVNGQGCITIKRLLVHESRYDEVAAALSKFAAEQVLGDGFDPATTIGPIQNRAQLLRLQATWAAIQKDGVAVLYRGDEIEGKGNFFPITILDNPSPHADYVKLENFGPLRSLIKYGTIDEAIEIANSTDYGLGGSAWGRDPAQLDAVAYRMEAGTVWINQHLVVNPNVPFGGNKDSGFGVQYGAEGLKEYCYLRVISAKTWGTCLRFGVNRNRPIGSRQRQIPPYFSRPSRQQLKRPGDPPGKNPNDLSVRYLRLHRSGSRQRRLRRGQPLGQRPWGDGVAFGGRAARRQYADPHARWRRQNRVREIALHQALHFDAPARARGASRRHHARERRWRGKLGQRHDLRSRLQGRL